VSLEVIFDMKAIQTV